VTVRVYTRFVPATTGSGLSTMSKLKSERVMMFADRCDCHWLNWGNNRLLGGSSSAVQGSGIINNPAVPECNQSCNYHLRVCATIGKLQVIGRSTRRMPRYSSKQSGAGAGFWSERHFGIRNRCYDGTINNIRPRNDRLRIVSRLHPHLPG
jgi:hypothetical protein